jgi:hypothetical protein
MTLVMGMVRKASMSYEVRKMIRSEWTLDIGVWMVGLGTGY